MKRSSTEPQAARDEPPAIEARGAAVALGGRLVWSGVDLDVPSASFTVILGPNGAGKSTFLRAVLGLQPLSAGSMRVLGEAPERARRRIGYVPQHAGYDATVRMRGIDVVRLGLTGDRWGIPLPGPARAAERARVRQVVDMVDAAPYAERSIGVLSGGEQQRLIIAQALAKRPEMLLLDEPLDNLDLSSQTSVSSLLQRICRSEGVTVVMVAHDVNPILPYLDRVIYVAAGAAVSGTPQQVITTETLSALYRTDVEVLHASDGRLVVVGQPEAPAIHSERHTTSPH